LELLFSDVWGPAPTSVGGYKYYISFIDDFSKFSWVYLMHDRFEATSVFLQFQTHVERLLGTKIKCIQSDWGGEYQKIHNTFFRSLGIAHRVSCPHTHQQNGSAERKHRHIVETGLALLAHAHVPLKFWDEAFIAAVYLINRMPTRVIDNKTPIERLFGTTPNYSMLRIFGCACWPNLRPYNKHKLSFRSKECVFIGYSALHKGYKCLDIDSGRVYISRDVIFDEGVFPFSKKLTQQSQPNLSSPSHVLRMLHLGNGGNFIGNDHVLSVPANPPVTEHPVIFPSAQEPYPRLSQLVTGSPEHSGDSSTNMADTSLKSVSRPGVQTESVSGTAEPAGSVALESLPTYVLHPNVLPQQLAGQTPPERVPHATANVD
jgi:hypothetical protein